VNGVVIPFTRLSSETSRENGKAGRPESESDRRARIMDIREALALRSGKVKLQRKLRRDEDAVMLATRLGADLERVKKQGRGVLTLTLEQAGLRPSERPRYALVGEDGNSEKRIRKLQPYVRLSDAIADALGQDRDLFLDDKLNGIQLMESDIPSDAEAAKLSYLLDQMAKAVAEQTELSAFFDLAAQTPGRMDEWGRIQPSTMTVLRDRWHEDGHDHWTEQQPIPSVPICRIFEQAFNGRARIAPWAKLDASKLSELVEAVDGPLAREVVDFSVEIWREIGLAIGERSQRGAIGPMFSGHAHIKVKIEGIDATPFYPWTLEHFFLDTPAILVEGDRWTACRVELDLGEDFSDVWVEPVPPPGEPNYAVEHYYFSKHPVNVWNLRRLLDRAESDQPAAASLLPGLAPTQRNRTFRFSGEIGKQFEVALAAGELESALTSEINRLKTELSRYLSERQETLAAQDEEMLARWRTGERRKSDNSEVF
jgi:hypothetical protein